MTRCIDIKKWTDAELQEEVLADIAETDVWQEIEFLNQCKGVILREMGRRVANQILDDEFEEIFGKA